MYFRNYGQANRLLHKYLKNFVSQYPSTSNMVKALKQISNYYSGTFIILSYHAPLSYFLITDSRTEFEKVTLSDTQNVITLC